MKIDCKQCTLPLIIIYITDVIGGFFFIRKEFYKSTTNVYKIKYMPKKNEMKIMIFFFCQFRGASFTSFFKTYNLTKY